MNLYLDDGSKKTEQCLICGESFSSNSNKRKYCYTCVPSGLTSTERLRRKQKVIKHALIEYKGGKCERCGYQKCEAALHFHHKDPNEKDFTISEVNLNAGMVTMDDLYKEADKCMLLCANCHAEEHYS